MKRIMLIVFAVSLVSLVIFRQGFYAQETFTCFGLTFTCPAGTTTLCSSTGKPFCPSPSLQHSVCSGKDFFCFADKNPTCGSDGKGYCLLPGQQLVICDGKAFACPIDAKPLCNAGSAVCGVEKTGLGKGVKSTCTGDELPVFGVLAELAGGPDLKSSFTSRFSSACTDILDPTTSFDISSITPYREVVAGLFMKTLLPGTYTRTVEYHRASDDFLIIRWKDTFAYTIPRHDIHFSVIGYVPCEIVNNGNYYVTWKLTGSGVDISKRIDFSVTGVTDPLLPFKLTVKPTQAKANENIEITVEGCGDTGKGSNVGINSLHAKFIPKGEEKEKWNTCVCGSSSTAPTCSSVSVSYDSPGPKVCRNTWTTKESTPGTYSYKGYVYDKELKGHTTTPESVSVIVKPECTANSECPADKPYCSAGTCVLDATPPTTTASATSGGASYSFGAWTKNSVSVTLSCSDSGGSGCSTTKYCIDTSNTCDPDQGTIYTSPFTLSTEGTRYVRYYSSDNAGNPEAEQSKTIKIDTTPPTVYILISPSSPTDKNQVTFSAAASDNVGVTKTRIYIDENNDGDFVDSGEQHECAASPCSVTRGPYAAGKKIDYYAWARDAAENQGSTSINSFTTKTSCTGNIQFTINPSSTGTGDEVTFQVSGLSGCSGRTVNFKTNPPDPFAGSIVASCTSSDTGCSTQYTAPSSTGTYTFYSTVDMNNNGVINTDEYSSATLKVLLCSSTPPSQTLILGNKCELTISAYGRDITPGSPSEGKYKSPSTLSDTVFDDEPVGKGGCDMDIEFSNNWTTSTSSISVASTHIDNENSQNLVFGYKLAVTSPNCKPLGAGTCSGGKTDCVTNYDTKSFTVTYDENVVKKGQSGTSSISIGECSTTSDCTTLKGPGYKCDADKICVPTDCGTCTSPNAFSGELNNYGDTLTRKTCDISGDVQDDMLKFTVNKEGYLIGEITKEIGVDLTLEGIVSGSNYCTGTATYLTPGVTNTLTTDKKLSPGTYTILPTWVSGLGKADVSVKLVECTKDSGCGGDLGCTTDNRCVLRCGTASNPKDIGTMLSSSVIPKPTCLLSSLQPADFFKVTLSGTFHLKATLSRTDWDVLICTNPSNCEGTFVDYVGSGGTYVSENLIGGIYYIKVRKSFGGDGTGMLTLSKAECASNDRPDGTSSRCLTNNQYLRCSAPPQFINPTYTCIPGPCTPSSNCADNFCCSADPQLPPALREKDPLTGELAGKCVPLSTLRQPYLCTK